LCKITAAAPETLVSPEPPCDKTQRGGEAHASTHQIFSRGSGLATIAHHITAPEAALPHVFSEH
jgi:hypothetical protein